MATQPIVKYGGHKTYVAASVTTAADGLSDAIDIGGYSLKSIQISTAWTTADLTFRASAKTTDEMMSVYHTTAGTELTYTSSASYAISVNPVIFEGFRYVQLRSGIDGSAVAQAAAREVILGLDRIDK